MSSKSAKNPTAASKIETWAKNAKPGDTLRVSANPDTDPGKATALKTAVRGLAAAGVVTLSQRRQEEDGSTSCLATRSRA